MKNLTLTRASLLAILLLLFCANSKAEQTFQQTSIGIKTTLQSMNMEVQFFSPSIVRVVKYPVNTLLDKQSLSVVKTPELTDFTVNRLNDVVSLKTSDLDVKVDLKSGKVSYFDKVGSELFSEKENGTQFTPTIDVEKSTFIVKQSFLLEKDEPIYGLGQQQNGRLNQRGQKLELKNVNLKVCIPYIMSVKGYAVFWDNYASTVFNDDDEGTSFESLADCSDYYFMYGGSGDNVVAQMRDLTGDVPMEPLWSFGFLQSKERYRTQEELVSVVEKYRSIHVPLDGIIQDWQYWGKDSVWNAMSFDPIRYANPQEMVDKIHAMNAHLMIVAWPGFGPKTPQYKEFQDKKMLIKFDTWPLNNGVTIYDVYNPAARDIYWRYLNKGVFSKNTDAWWLDSSEPDHFNVKEIDFDQPTHLGSYRSVVNAFPLEHIKGIYEHQRATTSEKRVCILTRSAFAGQQRYGSNTWSGDVVSNWSNLQKQIPAALNFTLGGIPYWNADIGGFFLWDYKGRDALKNNAFLELYARWFQFGTFTPMMRSHGTDAPREIYQFGKRGDRTFDVMEKYINLRYSLLPYIYSSAWDVTKNSGSFMRALFMDFAADKTTHNLNNEYMFGRSILVAPVVTPLYVSSQDGKGTDDYSIAKTISVYLPKGTDWIDFWTGKTIQGGQNVDKEVPIDIIPLYLKAGSILPIGPKVEYALEKKWDNLEIRIYPGANGTFTLYEDENDNYNYEQGAFSTIKFVWNNKRKSLSIEDRKGEFKGMLAKRKFSIVVVGENDGVGAIPAQSPKIVEYNGKKTTVKL